ncbi:S1C family serine protease [Pelagibius sp. Alg239-R121]|uniref:S1C family serine protease n=1 Tax=Pelagibius sp. Alg239-R121 TaxID=2993448 RepID=UPI0024A63AB0|nr:trypsin-like peptidase domain-containing protein [Pelagibius sp. Alg239-R121]
MQFIPAVLRTLCLGILTLAIAATPAQTEHAETAWQVASPSVVTVQPTWPGYQRPGFGAPAGTAPEGSGVAILESGLIVTAAHVVARATEVAVRDHQGNRVEAEILAVDIASDLALLKVATQTLPITIAADRPATGAHVCAIANAFGLDLSITCGIVSANARSGIGFNPIEDFIQTDTAVNPGASGGALVDEQGRLVGLLSAIFTKESDANAGVNFAVSTELLLRRVELMRETEGSKTQ